MRVALYCGNVGLLAGVVSTYRRLLSKINNHACTNKWPEKYIITEENASFLTKDNDRVGNVPTSYKRLKKPCFTSPRTCLICPVIDSYIYVEVYGPVDVNHTESRT